jgi:aspartate carbamoyltransferase catalytic subunit
MPKSLIELRDWSAQEIKNLLQFSLSLEQKSHFKTQSNVSVGLLFFEASTRTRISFEIATHKEGLNSFLISSSLGTSLEKGESLEDTLDNILAMSPDLLVVRSNDQLDQQKLSQISTLPIISAGWGKRSHPTQALLDIRALMKQNVSVPEIKMVIIGDIKHSRVASSHFQLSEKLGYQVAVLCEDDMMPESKVRRLGTLEEALSWGNVIMPLRFQHERHATKSENLNVKKFQINRSHLDAMKSNSYLMHPGPINYGSELHEDVKNHKQNLILSQVESGVWIRRACLQHLLEVSR